MKIRLEVGQSNSKAFHWFVQKAKEHRSYKVDTSKKIAVYVLEFKSWNEFGAYWEHTPSRRTFVCIDGKAIARTEIWRRYYQAQGLDQFGRPLWCSDGLNALAAIRLLPEK